MARSSIDDRAFVLSKGTAIKLININKRKHLPDLAISERVNTFYGFPRDGSRRVRSYPPNALLPSQNYFNSNVISYNLYTDALARTWAQGYFQDGDVELDEDLFGPVYWDATNTCWKLGFRIGTQTSGAYGEKPRPICLVDDGEGVIAAADLVPEHAGLYFVAQASSGGELASSLEAAGGWIAHWDGLAPDTPDEVDTSDWYRRTTTTELLDNGTEFGYGFTGDFNAGADLTGFDPTVVPLFPKSTYSDRHDIDADSPGFGHFWVGFPAVLFFYSTRWYALARGYIYDRGEDPIDDGTLDYPRYAANALWQLNSGEVPTNVPAWATVKAVFAPYDVNAPFDALGSGGEEHSLNHMWQVNQGGAIYFSACPINLPTAGIDEAALTNLTAVHCLDGGGLHDSLQWYDTTCTGGPPVQVDGALYFPMLSVAEQQMFIWRLDSGPDVWLLAGSHPLTSSDEVDGSRPYIADAYGTGGRIYIAWGRRPTIWNDAPITAGDGPSTAWSVLTWVIGTGSWRAMSSAFPNDAFTTSIQEGLFPRMFPLPHLDIPIPGGGGPGIGDGPCDDTFSAFGTPTISEAVFGSVMSSFSSPLLGEHTATYFYGLCTAAGVNPAFALAQWVKETQVGSVPGASAGFNNVALIRCHSWGTTIGCGYTNPANGYFAMYANWSDSIQDYVDLISGPVYAGKSISAIIAIYAPSSENDTELYITQVCDRMLEWQIASGL
jgi:hypothetical protein